MLKTMRNRLIKDIPLERNLIIFNLILILYFLIIIFLFREKTIGFSDYLAEFGCFNNFIKHIYKGYFHTNGRLGFFISSSLFSTIVNLFRITPFEFNWFILKTFNYFIYCLFFLFLIQIIFTFINNKYYKSEYLDLLLFVGFFLYIVCNSWFINQFYRLFVLLFNYILPEFILMIVFLYFNKINNIIKILLLLWALTSNEQIIPMYLLFVCVLYILVKKNSSIKIKIGLKDSIYLFIYGILSFIIIYISPGQQNRMQILHANSLNIVRWINKSVEISSIYLNINKYILYIILLIMIIKLLYVLFKINIINNQILKKEKLTMLYFISVALIGLFFSGTSPLIVSKYFPARAFLLPLPFLVFGILIFFYVFILEHFNTKTLNIIFLIIFIIVTNSKNVIYALSTISKKVAVDNYRYRVYKKIFNKKITRTIFLNNTISDFDSSWGKEGIRRWMLRFTNYNMPKILTPKEVNINIAKYKFKQFLSIDMVVPPPKFFSVFDRNYNLNPIRTQYGIDMSRINSNKKKGIIIVDFPFLDYNYYQLKIYYNPCIEGSASYRTVRIFDVVTYKGTRGYKINYFEVIRSDFGKEKIALSIVNKYGKKQLPPIKKKFNDIFRYKSKYFLRVKFENVPLRHFNYFGAFLSVKVIR